MALEKERLLEDSNFRADTHLNICAVLSQMGMHDLALHHAMQSIIICQSSLLINFLPDTKTSRKRDIKHNKDEFDDKGFPKITDDKKNELKKELKERISILCVAYHNMGVQQEFLKMIPEALESYKNACFFSQKYFGETNAIYQQMREVYNKAKSAHEAQVAR